jgi:hypothetical protein
LIVDFLIKFCEDFAFPIWEEEEKEFGMIGGTFGMWMIPRKNGIKPKKTRDADIDMKGLLKIKKQMGSRGEGYRPKQELGKSSRFSEDKVIMKGPCTSIVEDAIGSEGNWMDKHLHAKL